MRSIYCSNWQFGRCTQSEMRTQAWSKQKPQLHKNMCIRHFSSSLFAYATRSSPALQPPAIQPSAFASSEVNSMPFPYLSVKALFFFCFCSCCWRWQQSDDDVLLQTRFSLYAQQSARRKCSNCYWKWHLCRCKACIQSAAGHPVIHLAAGAAAAHYYRLGFCCLASHYCLPPFWHLSRCWQMRKQRTKWSIGRNLLAAGQMISFA